MDCACILKEFNYWNVVVRCLYLRFQSTSGYKITMSNAFKLPDGFFLSALCWVLDIPSLCLCNIVKLS